MQRENNTGLENMSLFLAVDLILQGERIERFNQNLKESFYYPIVTLKLQIKDNLLSFNLKFKKWLLKIANHCLLKERESRSPLQVFAEEPTNASTASYSLFCSTT